MQNNETVSVKTYHALEAQNEYKATSWFVESVNMGDFVVLRQHCTTRHNGEESPAFYSPVRIDPQF